MSQLQIVIDFTSFGQSDNELKPVFQWIKDSFFERSELFSLEIIMLESQFEWVPRSFDTVDRLTFSKYTITEDAEAEVLNRTQAGTLVLSAMTTLPRKYSALFQYDRHQGIVVVPQNAVARFLADGHLPDGLKPNDKLDLEDLGYTPQRCELADTPAARRQVEINVSDPLTAHKAETPGERLYLARTLDVWAAPTLYEVDLHRLKKLQSTLDIETDEGTSDEWALIIRAAEWKPHPPLAFLKLGEPLKLYILNWNEEAPNKPGVFAVQAEVLRPELPLLINHISGWTIDDALDDPYLHKAVKVLIADGADEFRTRHARVTLLLNQGKATKCGGWHFNCQNWPPDLFSDG